jgi:hypothetical protein
LTAQLSNLPSLPVSGARAAGEELEAVMTGESRLRRAALDVEPAAGLGAPAARSAPAAAVRAGLSANGQDPLFRYEPPTDKNTFRRFLRGSYESHPALSLTIGLAVGGALFLAALAGPFYFLGEVAAPAGKLLVAGGALVNIIMGPLIQKAGRTGKWILGAAWQAPVAVSGFILRRWGCPSRARSCSSTPWAASTSCASARPGPRTSSTRPCRRWSSRPSSP